MKVAFISLIPYDTYYSELININSGDPDYFDREVLTNHSDPVHKWCKMLTSNNINIEFWYLSHYSSDIKVFSHKYGHKIRRIPSFNIKKYFSNIDRLGIRANQSITTKYLQIGKLLLSGSSVTLLYSTFQYLKAGEVTVKL